MKSVTENIGGFIHRRSQGTYGAKAVIQTIWMYSEASSWC